MARKVGDLFVALGLHSEDYHKKLTKAQRAAQTESRKIQAEFNNLAKYSAIAFTAVAAAATIAIKKTADYADTIDEMAARTGESTTRLQELDYIAKVTGTSMEGLQRAIKNVSTKMLDADNGNKEALRTFKALNIAYKNADGSLRKVDDVITDSSVSLSRMTDKTRMLALASDLYGRGAQELLPALLSNRDGMAKLAQNAHDYGYIMTEEVIRANAMFKDGLDTLKFSGQGLAMMFGSRMIPELQKYVDLGLDWVKNNKDIIGQKMDTVVKGIGSGLDLIAQNKEPILAIMQTIAGTCELLLRSAGAWATMGAAIGTYAGKMGSATMYNPYGNTINKSAQFPKPTKQLTSPGMLTAAEVSSIYGTGAAPVTSGAGGGKASGSVGIGGFGGYPWIGGADTGAKATDMLRKSWGQRKQIYMDIEKELFDDESKYQDIRLGLMKEKWDYEQEVMNERMGMWASFGDNMASVLSNSVMEAGNAFENIQKGFSRMLEIMAAQMMAKAAVFGILNMFTGGGFSAFAGGLSKYVFGFRASGGPVAAGKSYVVGERGPELFTPNQSGRIISNQNINDNSRMVVNFSGADKSAMSAMSDLQLAERLKRVIRDYHLVGAY
jgi:hypothetical protein